MELTGFIFLTFFSFVVVVVVAVVVKINSVTEIVENHPSCGSCCNGNCRGKMGQTGTKNCVTSFLDDHIQLVNILGCGRHMSVYFKNKHKHMDIQYGFKLYLLDRSMYFEVTFFIFFVSYVCNFLASDQMYWMSLSLQLSAVAKVLTKHLHLETIL